MQEMTWTKMTTNWKSVALQMKKEVGEEGKEEEKEEEEEEEVDREDKQKKLEAPVEEG